MKIELTTLAAGPSGVLLPGEYDKDVLESAGIDPKALAGEKPKEEKTEPKEETTKPAAKSKGSK